MTHPDVEQLDTAYRAGCPLCEQNRGLDDAPEREKVMVFEHWRVSVHRSGLPGWALLVPDRHIATLADLSPGEATELGSVLQQATQAMINGLGAEKSYVLMFAEATKHVHFSLVPRMSDQPANRRGPAVTAYNSESHPGITDEQRDEIAGKLRAAWRATSTTP